MTEGNVIEVHNVSKSFRIYNDKSNSLKEKILHRERSGYQERLVLDNMDFSVRKGEAVGLVGCNGCGKSTTLKLLTKIIYPDSGSIEIDGRVSSLLELGAGFHPDMSGYENIYLNAAVFGLTRREIDNRVEEIIRFSELKDFINNPIRTYSSGMYMKLAFSVAINVDADILLIDEILGVGDVNFQKKCFEKLLQIRDAGTTIVIVSHSTDQIEKICNRSIWIENGKVRYMGEPKDVHARYLERMNEKRILQEKLEREERERQEELVRVERQRQEEKRRERIKVRSKEEQQKYKSQQEQTTKEKEKLSEEAKREQAHRLELERQIQKEQLRQQELEDHAEKKRRELESLQEDVVRKKAQGDQLEYFRSEKARLEVVAQEKNMELERLNSVIEEKKTEKEHLESLLKERDNQIRQIVLDKDTEIQRLEGVIRMKETENDVLREQLAAAGV